MATPQEALDIQGQRALILEQVNALKAKSRELKKQYDRIVEKANLAYKLGIVTEDDKAKLRELLDD